MDIPRIVLAGTSSGVGKTLVSCGLILALARAGRSVQPFKAGPDYIDPGHLSRAAGRQAVNLDAWLMGERGVLESFAAHSGADVSVVEGVMGYFDGRTGGSSSSSTHHVASIIRAPVVLVLDASGAARSVAATALGFRRFRGGSRIRGVILNRLAGSRHERFCRDALASVGIPVLGCVPRDARMSLESRHLGLVPAAESARQSARVMRAARAAADFLDAEALLRVCEAAPPLPGPPRRRPRRAPPRAAIAVALDASFNFYYRDNLEALERQGAELRFFSPEADGAPPRCDGLYIGGGFPEVRAAALSRNSRMREKVRRLAEGGAPVYAECGGLMYLTDSISSGGRSYRMAGLLGGRTVMTRRATLNYTSAAVVRGCLVAPRSARLRGHEFHYSEVRDLPADARFAYELSAGRGVRDGMDGLVAHGALASYGHLYFGRAAAGRMVRACALASRR